MTSSSSADVFSILAPKIDYAVFHGKTLVLPVVSAANLPQLAADLLIASLSLTRVAILDPSTLIPVAGSREDGVDGVTTPIEVFGKAGSDVYVLQQRSPALSSMKTEFTQMLTSFIHSAQFASILVLCGVDVSARSDRHMAEPIYHYILPPASPNDLLQNRLPELARPFVFPASNDVPFVPGGGLARRILLALQNRGDVAVGALLQFVMEGDNRADAQLLASTASRVVGLTVTEWKEPMSWKVGLFGTPQEQTLYG